VKRKLLSDPKAPDAGDATARCTKLEEQLSHLPAGDERKALTAEKDRLCSLEVPLLGANAALAQVTLSPSQASRKLMCGFAQKDFDKARASKPNDRRVLDLGQRVRQLCK
jgi:hypothetical protein